MSRKIGEVKMDDMAFIIGKMLENKIAIAENNNQNTLLVTLDALKCILALLKEQEAVEPTISGSGLHDGHGSWWYQCGKCKMPIDHGDKFCRHCGNAEKWND